MLTYLYLVYVYLGLADEFSFKENFVVVYLLLACLLVCLLAYTTYLDWCKRLKKSDVMDHSRGGNA